MVRGGEGIGEEDEAAERQKRSATLGQRLLAIAHKRWLGQSRVLVGERLGQSILPEQGRGKNLCKTSS